jgi:hypothetical protein
MEISQTEIKPIEGKITKLSDRGWGFIMSPNLKFTRVFFFWSALAQNTLHFTELKVGMRVRFVPIRYKDQGIRATRIEVIVDEGAHLLSNVDNK